LEIIIERHVPRRDKALLTFKNSRKSEKQLRRKNKAAQGLNKLKARIRMVPIKVGLGTEGGKDDFSLDTSPITLYTENRESSYHFIHFCLIP
jgi:hypothetical protein